MENKHTAGTKFYHDPITKECKRCSDENVPEGWLPKRTKNDKNPFNKNIRKCLITGQTLILDKIEDTAFTGTHRSTHLITFEVDGKKYASASVDAVTSKIGLKDAAAIRNVLRLKPMKRSKAYVSAIRHKVTGIEIDKITQEILNEIKKSHEWIF